MSDLISREALMRRIQSEGKHQASQNANRYDPIVLAYGDCYAMAKTAPAVDAIEVVRCKDCESYHKLDECGGQCRCVDRDIFSDSENDFEAVYADDYCSHGTRATSGESEVSE